jgi:polyisoprenoid-binding protein YceI
VKAAPANLHFTVAPTGNEARYRVREQLIGFDFPNDAVGVTHDITGSLVVQPNGTIIPDSSVITVGIQSLKSDKSSRDKYIHSNSIESDKYPTVQFAPKSFAGLTAKPGATAGAFDLTGDLTVHGVTHPVTWQVSAHEAGDDILGTATTKFTFQDFGMQPPKKAILLSVMDTVKLEYDFHFVQAQVAANQ